MMTTLDVEREVRAVAPDVHLVPALSDALVGYALQAGRYIPLYDTMRSIGILRAKLNITYAEAESYLQAFHTRCEGPAFVTLIRKV